MEAKAAQMNALSNSTAVRISCVVTLAAMAVWTAAAMAVYAQSSEPICTVEVSRPGAAVAPICRGQQIEEFNYQFEGGLYAQLIRNPSFEELRDALAGWKLMKPGELLIGNWFSGTFLYWTLRG